MLKLVTTYQDLAGSSFETLVFINRDFPSVLKDIAALSDRQDNPTAYVIVISGHGHFSPDPGLCILDIDAHLNDHTHATLTINSLISSLNFDTTASLSLIIDCCDSSYIRLDNRFLREICFPKSSAGLEILTSGVCDTSTTQYDFITLLRIFIQLGYYSFGTNHSHIGDIARGMLTLGLHPNIGYQNTNSGSYVHLPKPPQPSLPFSIFCRLLSKTATVQLDAIDEISSEMSKFTLHELKIVDEILTTIQPGNTSVSNNISALRNRAGAYVNPLATNKSRPQAYIVFAAHLSFWNTVVAESLIKSGFRVESYCLLEGAFHEKLGELIQQDNLPVIFLLDTNVITEIEILFPTSHSRLLSALSQQQANLLPLSIGKRSIGDFAHFIDTLSVDRMNSIENLLNEFLQSFKNFCPISLTEPQMSNFGLIRRDDAALTNRLSYYESSLPRRDNTLTASLKREAKFIVMRAGDDYVLAITDTHAKLDFKKIQQATNCTDKVRLASHSELEALGFSGNCVDPFFEDPNDTFRFIFFDAILYTQYLMAPQSRFLLPNYLANGKAKKFKSISAAYRGFLAHFGAHKLRPEVISRSKELSDSLLLKLLHSVPIQTRFAPTPSNSLHIGSLRTALASFLLARSSKNSGHFHIRMDDTDTIRLGPNSDIYKKLILKDLDWLGIGSNYYSQTDHGATKNYKAALDLLIDHGLCKQDNDRVFLDVSAMNENSAFSRVAWIDAVKGPTVLHRIPQTSPKGDPLNFDVAWKSEETSTGWKYLYKFAGAVDDLMHNSLVVRDVRQQNSYFTCKQMAIQSALRHAFATNRDPSYMATAREAIDLLQRTGRQANHSVRPLPFLCPSWYLHVGLVYGDDETPLSKRNLRQNPSIEKIRVNGIYSPEGILVTLLSSFGQEYLASAGYKNPKELIEEVSEIGAETTLKLLPKRSNFTRFLKILTQERCRLAKIKRQDALCLRHMSNVVFKKNVSAPDLRHNQDGREEIPQQIIESLYEHREAFSGFSEVSQFLYWLTLLIERRKSERSNGYHSTSLVRSKHKLTELSTLTDIECTAHIREHRRVYRNIRRLLMGREVGPSATTLVSIVGDTMLSYLANQNKSIGA
ncbi:MAG: glutamate--tRNA ligase family protein [Roseobacter sp.]